MTKETRPCRTYITWKDGSRTSLEEYVKHVETGKPCRMLPDIGDTPDALIRTGREVRVDAGLFDANRVEKLHDALSAAVANEPEALTDEAPEKATVASVSVLQARINSLEAQIASAQSRKPEVQRVVTLPHIIRLAPAPADAAQVERLQEAIKAARARMDEMTKKRKAAAEVYEATRNPYPVGSLAGSIYDYFSKRSMEQPRKAARVHVGADVKINDAGLPVSRDGDGARGKIGADGAWIPEVKNETVSSRLMRDYQEDANKAVYEALKSADVPAPEFSGAQGFTPEQDKKGENVIHGLVSYHFEGGQVIELDNITRIVGSGTWLRVWSDAGLTIIDTEKLTHSTDHFKGAGTVSLVIEKGRKVRFSNGKQLNVRNVTELDVRNPKFWNLRHADGATTVYTSKVDAVTVSV